MDYPVRVYGPNVYEVILSDYLAGLGLVLIGWVIASVIAPGALLVSTSVTGGLLAGVTGAAGLALMIGGAGLRQNRAALEVGFLMLAAVSIAWVAWAIAAGRAVPLIAGAVMAIAWIVLYVVRTAAIRARYRPRFFSPREFETLVQVADTMIDGDGQEAIDPIDIAVRTDHFLAEARSDTGPSIKLVFVAVEWLLPLLVLRPLPFSVLGSDVRRRAVTRVIGMNGPLRAIARTLKVLSCAGYYGNPETQRRIGYRPFDERERAHGVSQAPAHYPDPFLRKTKAS